MVISMLFQYVKMTRVHAEVEGPATFTLSQFWFIKKRTSVGALWAKFACSELCYDHQLKLDTVRFQAFLHIHSVSLRIHTIFSRIVCHNKCAVSKTTSLA